MLCRWRGCVDLHRHLRHHGRRGEGLERGLLHPEAIHREIFEPDLARESGVLDGEVAVGRIGKLGIAYDGVGVDSVFREAEAV